MLRAHGGDEDQRGGHRDAGRRARPPRDRDQREHRDERARRDATESRPATREGRGARWSQPPAPLPTANTPSEPPRRSARPPGPPVFLAPTAAAPPPSPETAPDLTPWGAALDRGVFDGTLHNVVTVHVARTQRSRDYDAGDSVFSRGETVAVESDGGAQAFGVVVQPCRRQMCRHRLPRVIRRVTDAESSSEPRGRRREIEVFRIARHIAGTLGLPIKIVRAEAEPNGKIVVFFASEERIDFRELHRRVSAAAQGRIELRQMGVRDAARVLGGCGPCGLQLCCTSFLREFAPVSIKMAKEQGLVLNPSRVSGLCGRLLCCLTYEDNLYRTQRKLLPKLGKRVVTPKGPGKVKDVDVLAQNIRVILETGEIAVFKPAEVSAMFPSQQRAGAESGEADDDATDAVADSDDPADADAKDPGSED